MAKPRHVCATQRATLELRSSAAKLADKGPADVTRPGSGRVVGNPSFIR
jgi:hypothetical protein